jgi:hypothetical protein
MVCIRREGNRERSAAEKPLVQNAITPACPPRNFPVACDPTRIDAECGDHVLQADFPLLSRWSQTTSFWRATRSLPSVRCSLFDQRRNLLWV